MKKALLSLAIAAALAANPPLGMADDHDEMEKRGKGKSEQMKGKGKVNRQKPDDEPEDLLDELDDEAEDAAEAAEEAEDAAEEAEEAAREAAEEALEDNDNEMEDDEGKPDVAPGMAKRDQHPSTGKGSEQGQKSRNAEDKPWWKIWN
ncbi:MAG: hypothetical protein V2J89_13050 [Halieaceae bacterium]|jgi:hypothetical protein|nr:hypothetical protein [Halieaceae bacterium]